MEIIINKSYDKFKKFKNIIIICAGDNSLHKKKKWFSKSRHYVLCVNYFGDSKEIYDDYKKNSDIFIASKGPNQPPPSVPRHFRLAHGPCAEDISQKGLPEHATVGGDG